MLGSNILGSTSLGSFFTSNIIIAVPAEFNFLGSPPHLFLESLVGDYEIVGVDGTIFFIAITTPPESEFNSELGDLILGSDQPTLDIEAGLSNLILVGLEPYSEIVGQDPELLLLSDSPTVNFEGVFGESSVFGSIEVVGGIPVFEFVGVDGIPRFIVNIKDKPHLIVNRSGNNVTITIPNQRNREVSIYKAAESKGTYTLLTKTSSLPYTDSPVTGNVKYKVAFSFTGTIGGVVSTDKGPFSQVKVTKDG